MIGKLKFLFILCIVALSPSFSMAQQSKIPESRAVLKLVRKQSDLKRSLCPVYVICEYSDGWLKFETTIPYTYINVSINSVETGQAINETVTPSNPCVYLQGETGSIVVSSDVDGKQIFTGEIMIE